jgi:hypothetical protein
MSCLYLVETVLGGGISFALLLYKFALHHGWP